MRKLTRLCIHHRLLTIAAWVLLLVGLTTAAQLAPGPTGNDYSVPGAPSAKASAFLADHGLDDGEATTAQIVLHDSAGLAAHQGAITSYARHLSAEHPTWEIRPGPGEAGALSEISADGTIGYLDVTVAEDTLGDAAKESAASAITDAAPKAPGLSVEYAGEIFPEPSSGPGESLGMLAAVVILLIAFGSLLAMALPLVIAAFGAGTGVMALGLAGHLIELPGAAGALAMMLAIGVGIDYSLLVVTRYRERLAAGRAPREAVMESMETAGHSVLVAGATVVVAILGLLVMNMPMVNGIAVGAALAIAMTMLAALTLLPALLVTVGKRIDKFGLPHRGRARDGHGGAFTRWANWVQRHPWGATIASLVALVALALPALDMRLGFADDGSSPTSTTQRRAFDLLSEGFGAGTHGPLVLAIDTAAVTGPAEQDALGAMGSRLEQVPGVDRVEGPFPSADGEAAAAIVVPATGPGDVATEDLVHRLRDDVLPGAALPAEVTGTTAAAVDFADYTRERLPVFVAVVLGLAFLLLARTYRSLVVPAKAVLMNLLSIGAAFGVVVAVVQWGWGAELLGFENPGPVTAWVPMMLVAVVFGLSMDYEVFLLSRIKEYVDRGHDNTEAVTLGLARTGRVITAAAATMVCVFGGFVLGHDLELKIFGLGLAAAVLIDATIVRMLLVPAAMALMGSANWWAPRWMRRREPVPAVTSDGTEPESTGSVAAGRVVAARCREDELSWTR
ncbi:MMPL family transporter [Nostocoides australiense]|nr:MMPL family transporter [Tetrasphaera sp.]